MKNETAIIGYTGFIGSNLIGISKNIDKFNSKNINKIQNRDYNLVVCAGTPSLRWIANKYPETDKENILNLISNLKKVKAKKFVLISTCEIYDNRKNSYDLINQYPKGKTYYTQNRILLEKFCKKNFKKSFIIRLPITYGKNFSKNFIFDLLNNNQVEKLNSNDLVQIYNVKNLIKHINYVLKNNINELNISSPPMSLGNISEKYFNIKLSKKKLFRKMNMKTIYSKENNHFFIEDKKTLEDLENFIKKYKKK